MLRVQLTQRQKKRTQILWLSIYWTGPYQTGGYHVHTNPCS